MDALCSEHGTTIHFHDSRRLRAGRVDGRTGGAPVTIILSAPSQSGYRTEIEDNDLTYTRNLAAQLLHCSRDEMIEVHVTGDGAEIAETTYCYASQADADADPDGAYAVQYEVRP